MPTEKQEHGHTATPWRTQGWVPTWAYIPIHDARHNLIASLYPDLAHGYSRDETQANAELIVAAVNERESLLAHNKALEADVRRKDEALRAAGEIINDLHNKGSHPHFQLLEQIKAALSPAPQPETKERG